MIRMATKGDLESLFSLMRQLSRHNFTKEQFELCYFHNLAHNFILVYEHNEHLCGCGVLSLNYHLHFSQKTAEVLDLIVDEKSRSQGIGKKLLAALEQIAIDHRCVCLEIDSGIQREEAHRFYIREGLRQTHLKFTKMLGEISNK